MGRAGNSPSFAEYRTVGEAADFLGVTPATLRNWDRTGKLKPRRHPQNGYRIYLQNDLENVLRSADMSMLVDSTLAPQIDWSDMGDTEHFVQFYENDEFLIDCVLGFIEASLRNGHGGLIIATADHRSALESKLLASGIDVAGLTAEGRFVALDASQALSRFMVDGLPDRTRFFESIGKSLSRLTESGRQVHAFGEMVALLWAEGNQQAAIRLESLWNELGKDHRFSLFCAYPLAGFSTGDDAAPFDSICGCHSRVIPSESYTVLNDPYGRLREITRLQQKARALEAEISHRTGAVASLSDRERELADFLNNATEGLHKVGPDGTILWANNAECELLGCLPQEVIGQHITRFHADAHVIQDILARLQRGESLKNVPARLRTKDGAIKHVLISSSACFENGAFAYTRCFTRDITVIKEAEKDRALLAAIIESSQDAIISKDLTGTITSWNRGAERLFGYSPAEAIGQPVTMLIPPDRLDEEKEILGRIRRGERLEHYETVRRCKNGALVDISLSVSPVKDARGTVMGASKIARDITERKKSEQILKDANRHKDEFLATLSHELRNPLAPIKNALEMLRIVGAQDEVAEECRNIMDRQVSLLTRLVGDLLDVSRITRGKIELRKKRLDIATVINSAVETSRPLIDAANHELSIVVPDDPVMVEVDPARMAQVFSNLLNNSAKYTPPRGRIQVTARCINSEVIVSVRDNGVGISCDALAYVFDMFRQVDGSLELAQGGLGIGLTIVRQLVEMHEGSVAALSEGPGKGSEFVVRLPAPEEPQAIRDDHSQSTAASSRRRILVVDDNKDSGSTLARLLKLLGHDTRTVVDGVEAIEVAEAFRPEVILMDVGMPRMNGYDATRQIRQQPWGRDMFIIALTGWGQPDDIKQSASAGCSAHLVKPVELAALNRLLADRASSEAS
jgi:PAS domain S-box-containing protein